MSVFVTILFVLAFISLAAYFVVKRQRAKRIELLCSQPFSEDWDQYLSGNLEIYPTLSPRLKDDLQAHTQRLMHTKSWEAAGGLVQVTDEMKLLVMAQAALLTIGRKPKKLYPKLVTIILYPSTYSDSGNRRFSNQQEQRDMLGESWTSGSVILSWSSVKRGAANEDDGKNVVIHEFAHQLDQADGRGDGAPILNDREEYRDWAEVFSKHYSELVKRTNKGQKTLLDKYGATNPAEFFAVATEGFFELRGSLKKKHPELYSELKDYYQLDPAKW